MNNKERETIKKSLKMLGMYDMTNRISMNMAINNTTNLLQSLLNSDNSNERSDEWIIDQYNRNRKPEDYIMDVSEIERHRGLEIGPDGTVISLD